MAGDPAWRSLLAMSGFGYWAHDIGGFEGNPDPALFKRWIAFGLFSSHSDCTAAARSASPGSSSRPRRHLVFWRISSPGTPADAISVFPSPRTHRTGVPMLRSALLEIPEEHAAWNLNAVLPRRQSFGGSRVQRRGRRNLPTCPRASGTDSWMANSGPVPIM